MDKMKISIKKHKLENWIKENGFTKTIVAKKLDMPVQEFKKKLNNHKPFTEEQVRDLVYFMGADEAFKVMYFPTVQDRERIKQEVFVKRDEQNAKLQEASAQTNRRKIT